MTTLPNTVSQPRSVLLWVLSSALAWSLVPVMLFYQVMRTYLEVALALPVFLLVGLLMGAICGLAQSAAWPGVLGRRWLWATVLGYGLALPAGLLISTLIPSLTWGFYGGEFRFMPLLEPGSVTFSPMPASAVFGAFVIGLCQWPVLKAWLGTTRPAMAWLWVFGQWAAIGLGLFEGGWVISRFYEFDWRSGWFLALHGAAWGAIAGVLSAGVLWLMQRENSSARRRAAAR